MNRRDYRCAFSGVSLLDREAAVILIEQRGDGWEPASLPLWGTYSGLGTLADIQEGPNAELILARFEADRQSGRLFVDFEQMGLAEQSIDHIETLVSVLACSGLSGARAVQTEEGALSFVFVSAHVAAAIMDGDPELQSSTSVESLPELVFGGKWARSVYAPLSELPIKLRCKFGLSLAGLLSFIQEARRARISFAPPGPGIDEEDAEPVLWLTEALVTAGENAALIEALEEYSERDDEA